MAPITSMPTELLYIIAKKLRSRDICSLRQTCHSLNAKLREFHYDTLYHTQRIFMVPVFIENFIKLTEDRDAEHTNRTRELIICLQIPYIPFVPSEYTPNAGISSIPSTGLQHAQDVNSMCSSRQQFEYLKTLFSIFQNVRTVTFENTPKKAATDREMGLLYPKLRMEDFLPLESVRKPNMVWIFLADEARDADNWVWSDTLEAIASAEQSNITTVGFGNRYGEKGIHISQFDRMPPSHMVLLKPGFTKLRRLELYVNFDDCNDDPCRGFGRWLENIGHQVEELYLSGTGNVYWVKEHRKLFLPTSIGLPKLTKLDMDLLTLDVDNLQSFLLHSPGLKILRISGCWFQGTPTRSVSTFKLLKFAYEKLRNLREFGLQLLCMYDDNMDVGIFIYKKFELQSFFLKVYGYWNLEETCTARLTRSKDDRVVVIDDIAAEIRRHPDMVDDERARVFWDSVLERDFQPEDSDEYDDY
ncbi:hypothetical protein TWF679_001832 [Orbilia oligospora]|uniref:F-box domain-containing protein n=1 Tax=Orbilia oligospora TaxID=2813651 RepID=A0A8H8VGN9_ORBOL|nr:hypothetical protein TWF679_001832 [Orbilia oligospora]